jgi:hypothetical protein
MIPPTEGVRSDGDRDAHARILQGAAWKADIAFVVVM